MIFIKTPEQIENMRIAGRLTAQVLEALTPIVQPGITTMDIEHFCEDYITNVLGAKPGSKGQYGYPYCVNTSVNHVICHGMPSDKQKLLPNDIVNVDITVIYNGFYGDSSKMFCIGEAPPFAKRLVDITQAAMYAGIQEVRPGSSLGDIGHAIQTMAEKHGYSVVREYCGHGIGQKMHEDPQVLHYGQKGQGMILEAGMTFTIEPMINQGKPDVKHLQKAGWMIAVTKDRKLSAQWEHTILVTPEGYEVLTWREEEQGFLNKFSTQ
jgi:methionyl aminopeptidase